MNGQCNWYSCPFRHISRQEFALEVTDLVRKQFIKVLKPTTEYRLMGNRLLEGDLYGPSSHMLPDRGFHQPMFERQHQQARQDPYAQPMFERQQQPRQDPFRPSVHDRLGGEDYLVSGMANLMRDSNFDVNQREIGKLRDELKMLNEENEKLKSRMISLEEDKHRSMPRHGAQPELEAMRLLGGNQFMLPQPQQMRTSNMAFVPNYYENKVRS